MKRYQKTVLSSSKIKETQNRYELFEARTVKFAMDVRCLLRMTHKNVLNMDDIRQLLRSSGSVAANHIEANNALSVKDCLNRMKICRKEVKESILWLKLLIFEREEVSQLEKREDLLREADQLARIFTTITEKLKVRLKKGDEMF